LSILLDVKSVTHSYDGVSETLSDVSFQLHQGECLVVLGSSGCGKSTLLKVIAGFIKPVSGELTLRGQKVTGGSTLVSPKNRRIGFLFQDASLFPHMTVKQNIEFGLKEAKVESREVYHSLIQKLALEDLLSRFPHEISGGQKQRVSLVRTLVLQPDLILMDEPFSSLDESFVDQFLPELKTILNETGASCLYVTHRLADLLPLADRVMVLKQGRVLQQGTFRELYSQPTNLSVAKFMGKGCVLDCHFRNQQWTCALGKVEIQGADPNKKSCQIFVRPHEVACASSGAAVFRLERVTFDGELYHLELSQGADRLIVLQQGEPDFVVGTQVPLTVTRQEPFQALSSD